MADPRASMTGADVKFSEAISSMPLLQDKSPYEYTLMERRFARLDGELTIRLHHGIELLLIDYQISDPSSSSWGEDSLQSIC